MKTFSGEMSFNGPRIHSAALLFMTNSGPMQRIEAEVTYDAAEDRSTVTADVSEARRGVWRLHLYPEPGACCMREVLVFIDSCPPTTLPGEYDDTATPVPIPSCDPEEETP